MFLNQLSNEEKNAFISLSVKISEANGVFDELEKGMIQEYCKEMEIPFLTQKKLIVLMLSLKYSRQLQIMLKE